MTRKNKFWKWVRSHKISVSFGTVIAVIGMCGTYIYTGADSLRTDIYQPLYLEIGEVDLAIHANNMGTNYSSEVYQRLTRNGSLGRIPKPIREKIIRLYDVAGEARGRIIPIAHKISVLMPQEIVKVRTKSDDKTWTEKTVVQLNADAASGLNQGSFPMAAFTFNHTGISLLLICGTKRILKSQVPEQSLGWSPTGWIFPRVLPRSPEFGGTLLT